MWPGGWAAIAEPSCISHTSLNKTGIRETVCGCCRFATTPKMPRSAASHSNSSGRQASQLGQPHHIRHWAATLLPIHNGTCKCNATHSAVVSIFTPPATNSYVFSILSLGASRIKQKPSIGGGQLQWLAAAASPRLRDGFRKPNFQNRRLVTSRG